VIIELANWRTGELANWRTGELANWRTGALAGSPEAADAILGRMDVSR
jgi:hypothetical protein